MNDSELWDRNKFKKKNCISFLIWKMGLQRPVFPVKDLFMNIKLENLGEFS